jgi:hypothetical protein
MSSFGGIRDIDLTLCDVRCDCNDTKSLLYFGGTLAAPSTAFMYDGLASARIVDVTLAVRGYSWPHLQKLASMLHREHVCIEIGNPLLTLLRDS